MSFTIPSGLVPQPLMAVGKFMYAKLWSKEQTDNREWNATKAEIVRTGLAAGAGIVAFVASTYGGYGNAKLIAAGALTLIDGRSGAIFIAAAVGGPAAKATVSAVRAQEFVTAGKQFAIVAGCWAALTDRWSNFVRNNVVCYFNLNNDRGPAQPVENK